MCAARKSCRGLARVVYSGYNFVAGNQCAISRYLFDHGEHSELPDPAYAAYGEFGFPPAPLDRPWIFANFVQTLDGIVSLLGDRGIRFGYLAVAEDRWLMDLLRAHADAVLIGMGTLRVETALGRPGPRGPVFRIADPALRRLRERLQRGPERNIFLTGSEDIQLDCYAAFDGRRSRSLSAHHVRRRGNTCSATAALPASARDSLRRRPLASISAEPWACFGASSAFAICSVKADRLCIRTCWSWT